MASIEDIERILDAKLKPIQDTVANLLFEKRHSPTRTEAMSDAADYRPSKDYETYKEYMEYIDGVLKPADEMNDKFKAEVRAGFDKLDTNKDGDICVTELARADEAHGMALGMGPGFYLSFDEYASFVFERVKNLKKLHGGGFLRIFEEKDENKTGRLTFAQVREVAKEWHMCTEVFAETYSGEFQNDMMTFTEEKWEEMMKKADTDRDGTINVKEFVSFLFLYI